MSCVREPNTQEETRQEPAKQGVRSASSVSSERKKGDLQSPFSSLTAGVE